MKRFYLCAVILVSANTLTVTADTNCVPPPSGLLSWWTAEGDARDAAGAGDAALVNGATFAVGRVGQAFSLDGAHAYVRLPDNFFPFPPAVPAGTSFSFETWFKTSTGGVILGQEAGVPFVSASGWVPGIYVGLDGKLRLEVFWNGSISPFATTQSVSDGVFHHVAATYDGTTQRSYLDGQLLDARAVNQTSYASSYSYQLGVGETSSWPGGNGGWFPFGGLIDEPALYNRALSSNEVSAIYLAGTAGKCPNSLPPVVFRQPPSFDAAAGSTVTLTVGVSGAAPLAYQWMFNGTNLPSGTNASLVLPNIAATQTGPYTVLITNGFGTAQSATGMVTVVFPLVLDSVVSNGVPFAGAGNLEAPGVQDVYTFDAPANHAIYMRVISAFNRLFWSLTAPDGSAVFTSHYMPYNDIGRLDLPMHGTYRLVVYNDSGIPGTYSFSISGLTDQTFNISVGSVVTNGVPGPGAGNLEFSGAHDDYLFSAPANGIVYLTALSTFNRLFWTLTGPDGSAVFTSHYMPYNDIGRLQLPTVGTYRLRVYNDDQFTGTYSFQLLGDVDQVFNIAVGDTVTNGVPGPGAGNLETPGTWDDYLFSAPTNLLVYFDVLSAPYRLFWSLYGPDDAAIFSARYLPYNDTRRVALPRAGTYRLRIYSDSPQTGPYSFRLTGLTDQFFNIAVGDTVTNGLPAAGAGNLEIPGTYDDYFFDATTNRAVYFDVLSAPYSLVWTLQAPDGSTVFANRYMPNNDVRRVDMPMPGIYRLRVYSDTDSTGPYSFKLWNVTDQTFNIAVGGTVTNGVPATGAGNLEMPGAYDEYLFAAPTNRLVFFDALSAPYRLFWTLYAPDGSLVFNSYYMPNNNVGRVELPVAGTYRLRVFSDNGGTGGYSLKLWTIIDQTFAISIGNVVTNGVPAPGAGQLQSPGSDDVYSFNANAGQAVHFDDRAASPQVASWRLVTPGGTQVFNDNLDNNDPGTFTLSTTGTYILHVHNNSRLSPVSYSFALVDSGTNTYTPLVADRFTINIGDLVSNGVPASGAGNLEIPGAVDIYTFTSGVGQVVFFEDRNSLNGQIRYDVYDSQWTPLFGEWLNGGQDIGRQTLDRGGTYYIVASGNNNTATGPYSFKLWPVTDQSFNIAIGDTISNGVPAIGAGNLETPGAHDVYTFTAAPGQAVYFEDRGASPNGQIRYDVFDDRGIALFGEWLNGGQDIGRQTLARGGTYTIVVSPYVNYTGTYVLKLWPVSGDQAFPINLGDTVANSSPGPGAGNIETPGVRDIYTFTVPAGQEVYFEDLGANPNGQFRFDVYDPRNTYLFGEWLNGGQDLGRQTLLLAGTYTIVVSGYVNYTGTYSFKLWPVAGDQHFTFNLGDTLSNNVPAVGAGRIEAPGLRDIYTFTASPGQVVFFEDLGSNPNGQFRYDLYDDRGVFLFGEWLNGNQDVARQTLARGGTYTLIASAYVNYTGTYSLKVWPVTDQFFSLNIGDVVTNGLPATGAGNIEVPGNHDVFTFTGAADQLVYFENRGSSSFRGLSYNVYDQDWTQLFGQYLDGDTPLGLHRLTRGGTYYIVAGTVGNGRGTYGFRLRDALPRILEQPLSARGLAGQAQSFSVQAESPYPLFYQWQFNGTNLPGATGAILNLASPGLNQAGPYDVIVSNSYGGVTSVVATLTLDSSELYVTASSPSGPVGTNVSQVRVQFNSPILTNSFTTAQILLTGPGGPVNSSSITIVPVDAQTFLLNFPAQSTEGAYTITIGPAITNQAGATMTASTYCGLYATDFAAGSGSVWSRGETLSNALPTRFLGEFANDTVTLFLAALPPHNQLRLVWDTLIIDNWDGNLAGPDKFGFNLTGLPQPAWEYTFHSSANPLAQSFPGFPDVSFTNFAGNSVLDAIYRNLRFDFPHTNDTLEISFYGRNLNGLSYGGWGLDNVRVLTLSSSNGVFTGRFAIDKTAPTVTSVSPSGTSPVPVSFVDLTFSETIQPQSLTTNAVVLRDPLGNPVLINTPQRLTAASFRLGFASQRYNGAYTLVVSPVVLDLAGNSMTAPATNTFNIQTPPVINTQPSDVTLVRNNTATFTVAVSATPPVQYAWNFNGVPIPSSNNATLALANVQTNQSGLYQVVVTDAGGSVTSAPAMLTVLPTYGPYIAQGQAARPFVPAVPGNGVFIQLYNGIGGGAAPVPSLVSNVTPSGTTLSPVIDFPHPGSTINVGSSFNNFFQDTTTPPDQVQGLSALNFILRDTFYLAVSRANDVHPETPEIDLRLGVGSDDGFYLQAGTNFLGSAGDRGFTYSWMDVSFQDEGLYPVTLLYAANAVGQSGLELSWQIGTNGLTQIVPQSALYISPDLGDRLITFEEVPVGTVLSNQYASTGMVFTAISGAVQVTTNFPGQFVPVSPTHVFGDPNPSPAQPGIVELSFVAPGSTNRATSDFVSFFIINAKSNAATVVAYDTGNHVLFTNAFHGGGASQELVTINAHGIARIRLNLGQGSQTAAIDNVAFLTPSSLPDLVVDITQSPTNALAGQPVQLVWRVTNQGFSVATGPWTDTVSLSPVPAPGGPLLTSVTYSNSLAVGGSLSVTQSVILPASQAGTRWFVVTANAAHVFTEGGSLTNNTAVAPVATIIQAADLAAQNLSAPGSAQLGQTVSVSWVVKNQGTAAATVSWNDRLVLSTSSNSLVNPVILLTTPAAATLAPGASYTNTQLVTLPLTGSLNPGTYYLWLQSDPDNAVADSNGANNLMEVAISLVLPPLPDLVAGRVTSPASAVAGQTVPITWTVTNLGIATATGPWRETIYLVPDGLPVGLLITNPTAFARVGAFTYSNTLTAGLAITRTQQVTIPFNGVGGDLRAGVIADMDDNVLEQNEFNNAALGINVLHVPVTLFMTLPVTNVLENTPTPNLACLVSRNGDLTASVIVSLTSSATNHLVVPASVTIGAGASSAPFTATVLDDGVLGPDVLVNISAQASAYGAVTSQVLVVNTDLPKLALALGASAIVEGQNIAATVTRATANSQPVAVSIVSSSSALSAPPLVTIPANSNSVTFTLMAVQNTAIEPAHVYTVTASAGGYSSVQTNLTVYDDDTPTLALTLERTNISEGDGPLATVGTVSRQPVTDQPITVALANSNAAAALVPAQVIIPPLQGQVTFNVAAVNDSVVSGPKRTLISAQALDALGNPIGAVATQLLTVQDDDGPALKLAIATKVVPKGMNPASSATVWRNTPPTNSVVVTLTSSAPNEASAPPTVTIPIGQTNATFNIASLNDGVPGSSQTVNFTASAAGYASASDQFVVTDSGLPDLTISSITVPAAAFTEAQVTLSFRLANQGLGPLTNAVTQDIFVTTDPASGNRVLAGTVPFGSPIAAGQSVNLSLLLPSSALPAPGNYWVVVTADAGGTASEVNEANNTSVSATPIFVTSEYTATVHAGLSNVVAGTPVPLYGSATLIAGGPAPNRPVNIVVTVRNLSRTFGVYTDTNGNFSTVFVPLPTEGGHYTVGAVAPGETNAPAQDQFTIYGMALSPATLVMNVIEGNTNNASVAVLNVGEVPLTGLSAVVNGLAANLSASAVLSSNALPGMGSVSLSLNVSAANASIRQSSFTVHLSSAEGASVDLPVAMTVIPLSARLASDPPQLAAAMLRGGQAILQFDVINFGGADSGPLTLSLPEAPWLSAATTNPLPNLAPGQTNRLTLVLTPAADLALGPYSGTLTVNGSGSTLLVPFIFTAVSDAHGALRVQATDEYTYFAPGNPPLTNASVTLIEPFSHAVVATGVTDTNGVFFTTNLTEGTYELDVTADRHSPYRGSATISAARTNDMETFLSRQTVQFVWTVVPTQVQDVTHITVLAEFEANVPSPVVVPTPSSLDLSPLDAPGKFIDVPLTLANYGLIAVQGVTISTSQNPNYQIDLLTHDVGTLPAHGSVTVPMRITRLAPPGPGDVKNLNGAKDICGIAIGIAYSYICGPNSVGKSVGIAVFGVVGDCPPGGGTIVIVGGPGGGGGAITIPPGRSGPTDCDPCMAQAIIECAIGFTPIGCPYSVIKCGYGIVTDSETAAEDCISGGVGCLGPWGNAASCLWSFLRCKCPGYTSQTAACIQQALGGGGQKDATVGLGLSPVDPRDVYAARSAVGLQLIQLMLGDTDGRWFSAGSGGAFGMWWTAFTQAIQTSSPSGLLISVNERTNLLTLPRPNTVSQADVQATLDRWNLSVTNWRALYYSPTNVPPGNNTNFIDAYLLGNVMGRLGDQYQISQAAGYTDPVAGYFAALQDAESKLGHGGVCARVILELDMDAVLTRDAFRATLQLNDNSADPLLNVAVNIRVRNAYGQDVTSTFGILPATLSGALTAVDGTGVLPPNSTGTAQWTLIPTLDAAPQTPTNYLVSGTFSYLQNGITVTIPLAPAAINVKPNPQLYVKYFHQRDVFSDDPFTPEIEPSIPYSLGVMVQNHGYGLAHEFKITSAQPKIVDNQKGLLIDFKIIGAQVGNNPVAPTLTVDFGDVAPGTSKVGRWLLTSTLQGLFIDYKATFEHVDPLGNPRLSLIDGVEIHEMTHLVRAPGSWDDGQPDFLVNDVADFNNLPDTLYLSDGRIQPVSVVQAGTPDAPASSNHLGVQFTVNFPAGFSYVRVPDPANGQLQLVGVTRANGSNFLAEDFWITDRTFVGLGQPPIRENVLHLFDYHTNAGPDIYTLVYAPPSTVQQTNPPVSAVFSLPAHSPPTFGVVWSGANYVGQAPIAYYDIFASDNGSAFGLWQTHTTDTIALYSGLFGHTYAFYSVATDTAGNVEAAPPTPDAVTSVDLTNRPPSISFAGNVTVNEGDTVVLTPTVSDSDVPAQTLTFRLLPGAPTGVVVDPASGQLRWTTGKSSGSTNLLREVVTDNGFPPLSATGTVTVIVRHINSTPILAPISNRTINEGFRLSITNSVTDYDLPADTFTWSLETGAPAGATINPTNGIFTWRPAANQGPSTNRIGVIVTDSGVPPLSATQQFTIIVRHVLPDFILSLGRTNVMTGEGGAMPLTLASTLDLTNITFLVGAPGPLTNLALQPALPEVTSASLQLLGSNTYAASLSLDPALQADATRALARLAFIATPTPHSAIVPVTLGSALGQRSAGQPVTNAATLSGRVIIVATEPMLDLGTGPALTVFGHVGALCSLQYRTNLVMGTWLEFARFVLTNRYILITNLPAPGPATFYRAEEVTSGAPTLGLQALGGAAFNLSLQGQPGVHYRIQTATNLNAPIPWSDLFNVTLTNSPRTFSYTNTGPGYRFFRAVSP